LIFLSVTIILQPFSIAVGINLLPSKLLPLIAKKISFLLTFELLKAIPEKKALKFFLALGI